MTPSHRNRLALPVVAVYWLLLVGGLAIDSTTRSHAPQVIIPLWIGAIGGTLLGQLLALHDLRLWISSLIILVAAYFAIPIMSAGFADTSLWKIFIPAALCGFWSLGDRSVVAAFWFPAVIWMLSILARTDGRTDGALVPDGSGVALLGGLAVLFLVFLRARESRRVGLWCAVSSVPLARSRPAALLKEPPGRPLVRAGWGVLVSAVTVALTAVVAPRLWQIEPLRGDEIQIADATEVPGLPCCPQARSAETDRSRVKEYLDLGLGRDDGAIPHREGIDCRACDGPAVVTLGYGRLEPGEPGGPGGAVIADDDGADSVSAYRTTGPPGTVVRVAAPEPVPVPSMPAIVDDPAPVVPDPASVPAPPPVEVVAPPSPPPVSPPPLRVAPPEASRLAERAPGSTPAARAPQRTALPSILPWLVALAAGALIFQLVGLALRPLRRLLTLRHLRRPFWDETIDQRVSNSWQLALVGLRDAGWRPGSGEAPRELAARVGIEGVERCAVVLERARHGVGIDAEDVAEMTAAADVAYRSARTRLGAVAGAIAWLRWPLT